MTCKICGRQNCTESFHSLEEQEEFDTKTGRYMSKEITQQEADAAMVEGFEQPPAGEFTKTMRKYYTNNPPKDKFKEALDRLDSAESINKELLEACEKASSIIQFRKIVMKQCPCPESVDEIIVILEAAIYKAKEK